MARPDFLMLDGEWEFEFDPNDIGQKAKWFNQPNFSKKINVPFCVESEASGLAIENPASIFWYAKQNLTLPKLAKGERLLLHFGAVDYAAKVWLNGQYLGEHAGGYTPFQFDITQFTAEKNLLVVRVEDKPSLVRPRGKQTIFTKAGGIFYPAVSGIWQSVWVEKAGAIYLKNFIVNPNLDQQTAHFSCELDGEAIEGKISCEIADPITNKTYKKITAFSGGQKKVEFEFQFNSVASWSPENPNLYIFNLKINSLGGEDNVQSYFGFRKIETKNQQVFLNNQPFYQKLALVQGYYPKGLYTPTKSTQYKEDLLALKKFGFNGLRLHQKIENPQFLFWCDILGCVVWEEMPSARHFNQATQTLLEKEWLEILERDRNHPAIIAWTIFNESWGLGPASLPILFFQKAIEFVKKMVKLTKEIDPSRLITDNSGFDHTEATDLVDLHLYLPTPTLTQNLLNRFRQSPDRWSWFNFGRGMSVRSFHRQRFARGEKYRGQPIIVSEYGAFDFFKAPQLDLAENFKNYTEVIRKETWISGYCFTQLYDTFQEKDGLMTFDRQPKVSASAIEEINSLS